MPLKKEEQAGAPGGPGQPEEDPSAVTLKGREHLNPHTWAVWYRWAITGLAGLLVLNASALAADPFIPPPLSY